MRPLTEKYRPRSLSELVGQDEILLRLRDYLDDPVSTAMVFSGGTGVGKTSAAKALAAELGCEVDSLCGGLIEMASGDQTADNVRSVLRSLWTRPMLGSGWKILIVSEADKMSPAVECLWLDALESLPPECCVIFTTNNPDKLSQRFADRCESFAFGRSDTESSQRLIDSIWFAETGRTDSPRLESLPGANRAGGLSPRAAVQALTPLVRAVKRPRKAVDAIVVISATNSGPDIRTATTKAVGILNAMSHALHGATGITILNAMVRILTDQGFNLVASTGSCEVWQDGSGTIVNLRTDVPEITSLDDRPIDLERDRPSFDIQPAKGYRDESRLNGVLSSRDAPGVFRRT